MYLYLNEAGNEFVGLMPTTRGRPPKNHVPETDDFGFECSYNTVPDSVYPLGSEACKKWVVANGENSTLKGALGVTYADKLLFILNCMSATMPNSTAKDIDTHRGIDGYINSVKNDPEYPNNISETKCQTIAAFLNKHKRDFNAAVASLTLPPAADAAAEEEESTAETEAPATYGFNRMSGDAPTLGVVGADGEMALEHGEHGVFYPKADKTYIINSKVEKLFTILEKAREACPQNVSLIGPHGCGKTELAIQFAARHSLPLLIMDCANLREARDWFGYKSAKEGTVYWHESQFVRAIQAGNHVIMLDELNRANPNLLNTLMPILDARRFTYLEERGDKIVVGPGTVFFASMNEGASYTGTSTLDRAVRDRFSRVVELTYLDAKDEINLLVARTGISKSLARGLVEMANKIRHDANGLTATLTETLSTRQLLAAAHDFVLGGVDTLTYTIINHFSADGEGDSERAKVQTLIQGKFGHLVQAEQVAAEKVGA